MTPSWTFNTDSLIHSDVTWAIYEAILTYWTNFWQISHWWWTFYIKTLTLSDDMSATENCVFDLMDILLSNWYSIFNFHYILIDSFWCYFSHVWTHFWTTEQISGRLVFDDEISIQTYWLFLVLHKTDSRPYLTLETYFWPKSAWSWTFYRYSLTLSDFISAIQKSIIDLLKKHFLSSIMNFVYIIIDSTWR